MIEGTDGQSQSLAIRRSSFYSPDKPSELGENDEEDGFEDLVSESSSNDEQNYVDSENTEEEEKSSSSE